MNERSNPPAMLGRIILPLIYPVPGMVMMTVSWNLMMSVISASINAYKNFHEVVPAFHKV